MKSLKEDIKCVMTVHTISLSTYFAISDRYFRKGHNMYWVENHVRLWVKGRFR